MAQRFAGKNTMRSIPVKIADIDDKVGYLEDEIQRGKRNKDIAIIAAEVLSKKKDGKWVIPERDWRGEVVALFNYVRENVRYTRDVEGVEVFRRPGRTLELKIGDCDDSTILLGSLLGAVGYPLMIRIVGLKPSREFQHVYLAVGLPPHRPIEWMPLDPSRPEAAGWEVPQSRVSISRDYMIEEEE